MPSLQNSFRISNRVMSYMSDIERDVKKAGKNAEDKAKEGVGTAEDKTRSGMDKAKDKAKDVME